MVEELEDAEDLFAEDEELLGLVLGWQSRLPQTGRISWMKKVGFSKVF